MPGGIEPRQRRSAAIESDERSFSAQQAALTDFRLYWNALTQALSGRDKVLLDTDRLPGRRNLLFGRSRNLPIRPYSCRQHRNARAVVANEGTMGLDSQEK